MFILLTNNNNNNINSENNSNNMDMNPLGSTSTIPMPVMTSTESLRANGLERKTGIWYLLKHNWRQLSSLVPGMILLCATGNLHTSWTIWQLLNYFFNYNHVDPSILVAWFVGVIFGSIAGAFLNTTWSKICIYYTVAVALLPVSLLFVIYQTSSYNFLLIGRSLAGTLYGVILITFILHIADNSSQFMRRYFISIISIITIMPTVLVAEFVSNITSIRDTIQSCGIIMFVLAIMTLIFMPCTYESIVFLLENGNDLRALEILLKLRNESRHYIRHDFNEFKMMLAEDRNYSGGCNIICDGNARPLYLLCLLRMLNVLVSGSAIYWIFIVLAWFDYHQWVLGPTNLVTQMLVVSENISTTEIPLLPTNSNTSTDFDNDDYYIRSYQADFGTSDDSFTENFSTNETTTPNGIDDFGPTEVLSTNRSIDYPNSLDPFNDMTPFIHMAYSYQLPSLPIAEILLIVFLIKILFGIPMMCLAEKFQIYRNRILFKITFCVGILNLIFFLSTWLCYRIIDDSLIFTFYMAKLLNLVYGTYLLITFSIETIGYTELAESFSLIKRYGSIACVTIIEQILHIIVILVLMNGQFEFYFHIVQSTIVCIFCHLLLKRMPIECLNCSLRIARDKYFVKMTSANH